ncbi:hypothetical protein AMTR_s00007p00155890 [Amborella trichopoda]|uniref:Aminotransferase-like plant mobile domain-containing protein n=1 Tax=Amborella trichopoda TaxID=13333 RepID=W1PC84_AMBTC|nr:hypothetical protein AMTR_s00007p00155890 [Amborella trichopoda]
MEDIQEVLRTLEKEEIRIDENSFQLNEWKLKEEQVELVNASGLGPLSIIRPYRIDHPLVSANVERWRSETNTFHFNIHIGEMTPTLFDVYEILGLTVDGEPITCRPISDLLYYIEENLGIVPDGNLTSLRHPWLKFFEDIEGASKYAWDAAALAFLYRSLGTACTFKRRHFSGSTTLMQCWSYEHIMHMWPISPNISPNFLRAKRWEPSKKYHGNPHNIMPPIRQEFDNLQPNDEAFETAMCLKLYMPDRVRRQFGAKHGIPRNPLVVGKRASRQGGYQNWRSVNADKIHHWLSCHECLMHDIQVDTDNGLPSEDYKEWYNLEEEAKYVVPAHEPQYIMRPRGYENQLVNAVQASTVMLAEALTLGQKWYPEVYNRVNNEFETLSKFVPVDMDDIEARMTSLQLEYHNKGVPNEAGHDGVGESSRVIKDLATSTKPAVEEPRRYNTRKKQYQSKRRRPM